MELRSGADLAAGRRPVFEPDAVRDEPSDVDMEFTGYGPWLADAWQHPPLSREPAVVALVDGRAATFP